MQRRQQARGKTPRARAKKEDGNDEDEENVVSGQGGVAQPERAAVQGFGLRQAEGDGPAG